MAFIYISILTSLYKPPIRSILAPIKAVHTCQKLDQVSTLWLQHKLSSYIYGTACLECQATRHNLKADKLWN